MEWATIDDLQSLKLSHTMFSWEFWLIKEFAKVSSLLNVPIFTVQTRAYGIANRYSGLGGSVHAVKNTFLKGEMSWFSRKTRFSDNYVSHEVSAVPQEMACWRQIKDRGSIVCPTRRICPCASNPKRQSHQEFPLNSLQMVHLFTNV